MKTHFEENSTLPVAVVVAAAAAVVDDESVVVVVMGADVAVTQMEV